MKNQKHVDYWKKRTLELEEILNKKGEDFYRELEKAYQEAIRKTEKDILKLYTRLASVNEISLSEAKKLLLNNELAEFKWDIEQYLKYARENELSGAWIKELENASLKVRISRLEAMKLTLRHHVEALMSKEYNEFPTVMGDIYTEGYYRTIHMIQTGLENGSSFALIDTNNVEKVLASAWVGEKTFSERIWGEHRVQLIEDLYKQLTQSVMRGEAPDRLINEITKKYNVSRGRAKTLVMTESAYFGNQAQQDCYKELDVEEQIFVATLDLKTSEICRENDGRIIKTSDVEVGVNAPPLHCNCRSVLAPYFEGNIKRRFARGKDGKGYYIDEYMTYEEWYKKYVENK